MTDDKDRRELAEVEAQLTSKRKTLAIVGLVLVGAVLAWRFAIMVDRTSGIEDRPKSPEVLEVEVSSSGQVRVRGCDDSVEHCVATAKVRFNKGGGGPYRAFLHVAPGAPEATVAETRTLLQAFEFTTR